MVEIAQTVGDATALLQHPNQRVEVVCWVWLPAFPVYRQVALCPGYDEMEVAQVFVGCKERYNMFVV